MKTKYGPGYQIINGYHVATIVSMGSHYGLAKCNGDIVRFTTDGRHNIVASGSQFPVFGEEDCPLAVPQVGESLVVFVFPNRVEGRWVAEAWARYEEFVAAKKAISERMQCPKSPTPLVVAAPQIAPVQKVATVPVAEVAPGKRVVTPRRYPTINVKPIAHDEVLDLEKAIRGGYVEEPAITADCSIAPAPQSTSVTQG